MTILSLVRRLLEYHEKFGDLECMVDAGASEDKLTSAFPSVTEITQNNRLTTTLPEDKTKRKVVWL